MKKRSEDMNGYPEGWIADDFTDAPDPQFGEKDPWAVQLDREGTETESPDGVLNVDSEVIVPRWSRPGASGTPDEDQFDFPEPDGWEDAQDFSIESYNGDSSAELAILLEWGEGQSDGNSGLLYPGTLDDVEHYTLNDLDEPEPSAEYDGELGQILYELDHEIPDLPRSIRVDQWLNTVQEMSDFQRREIAGLLLEFSGARLRRWLPWLCKQQWTGNSLLLFMQFRAFWDGNCDLWECLRWSPSLKVWYGMLNRNSLSLDNSYVLVQRRLGCSPDEVIDLEWFDDWDRMDIWLRVTQGFYSFSSFAMYRSSLSYAEDWRHRPDLQVDFYSPLRELIPALGKWDQRAHRYGPRLWFVGQDWYDPVEWHDGLGW